jgi:hypothetical protein
LRGRVVFLGAQKLLNGSQEAVFGGIKARDRAFRTLKTGNFFVFCGARSLYYLILATPPPRKSLRRGFLVANVGNGAFFSSEKYADFWWRPSVQALSGGVDFFIYAPFSRLQKKRGFEHCPRCFWGDLEKFSPSQIFPFCAPILTFS